MQCVFVDTERKRLNEQIEKGSLIMISLVTQWQLSLGCRISVRNCQVEFPEEKLARHTGKRHIYFPFGIKPNQIRKQEGYHFNIFPLKRKKENLNVSIKLYGSHKCNTMNFSIIGS